MQDSFESAFSVIELESSHQDVKSEILEELPTKWRIAQGSSDVPTKIRKLFEKRLESTFQKLKRQFEKSQQREQAKMSTIYIVNDAIAYYDEEIDKYLKNSPNASPKEIDLHHVKISNLTLKSATGKAGSQLDGQLLTTLKKEIEKRRKMYRERAEIVLKSNRDPALGIDLGTTMCCVMVFYKNKCEIIPNRSQGNSHTTPSYVSFHETNSDTFGWDAKLEAYKHPETTIYDAKRMIGRSFYDNKLQDDMKKWPFEVVNDNGNVKIKTWGRLRYPHEVSPRLLTRFRLMAEDHLTLSRGSIKKAVITVPAYFTEPQRRATHEAAECAGLQVLNIISEPSAAAIAYSWERRDAGSRRALIYDLGGGTFDVAIAKVTSSNVAVLCVDGDTHLGGQDFDQLLMDYCVWEFKKKEEIDLAYHFTSSSREIRNSARSALSRLKLQCEKAKERLTTSNQATVLVEKIFGTTDLSVVITRATLERLVRPLVQMTIDIIDRALEEANSKGIKSKLDIDDVILVGGSTRMPLVMEMITNYFDGKQLCKHINPDEAVAHGAAIQAAILNKNDSVKNIHVEDVTPMSLGTDMIGDVYSMLIPKNSKILCSIHKNYVTVADNQTVISCAVLQGENSVASKNKLLGTFHTEGIPPKPKSEEAVKVTMSIDSSGMLHAEAVSTTTGNSGSLTITADRMGMDKTTMEKVMAECLQINTH